MKNLIIFTVILALSSLINAQPGIDWIYTSDGYYEPSRLECMIETDDGNYIACGISDAYGVLVIKTDDKGNEIWANRYLSDIEGWGKWIIPASDGGYIITGWGWSPISSFILKIDENGNELWSQFYTAGDDIRGKRIVEASDGGYFMLSTYNIGVIEFFYIHKVDNNGIVQWERPGFIGYYAWGNDIAASEEGGCVVAGEAQIELGLNGTDLFIQKINREGYEMWTSFLVDTVNLKTCTNIENAPDGGFLLAGENVDPFSNNRDVYIHMTDSLGVLQWSNTIEDTAYEEWVSDMKVCQDGGFILTGEKRPYGYFDMNGYMLKTDNIGNEEWTTIYSDSTWEKTVSVIETYDGGYAAAGSFWHDETYDAYIIKIGQELEVSLRPLSTPIIIPAEGGTFSFEIEVSNNSANNEEFDLWTMITLPDGTECGPVINASGLNLDGGSFVSRERSQFVPGAAPAGEYIYTCYTGIYPDYIWDSDEFSFEKNGATNGEFNRNQFAAGEGFDSIDESKEIINSSFSIINCHPNPFNQRVAISYKLQAASCMDLSIYDVTGREVAILADGYQNAGNHEVIFDAKDLVSGVYFARLTVDGGQSMVRKMVLMK